MIKELKYIKNSSVYTLYLKNVNGYFEEINKVSV